MVRGAGIQKKKARLAGGGMFLCSSHVTLEMRLDLRVSLLPA